MVWFVGMGCSKPVENPQAQLPAAGADKKSKKLVRPPFPNMANALWGREVLKNLPAAEKPAKGHLANWLKHWHETVEGNTDVLQKEAWLYHQEAKLESEKNTALSLLAVSYCLDWSSPNYKERLVDAVGLVSLSGEGGKETLLGQVARAYVLAKAGLIHQAKTILDFLKSENMPTEDVALMKAMTLEVMGRHDDDYMSHLSHTLSKKNNSHRAQWMKATTLNKWGAYDAALQTLEKAPANLMLLRLAQAKAWMGQKKWQAARRHLSLDEDNRANLSQMTLGKLNYLEATIALALKDKALFDTRLNQLGLSPYFKAEERVLKALAHNDLATLTHQQLPRVNRVPMHLREDVVRLWLQWCVATQNEEFFNEAAKKAFALGLDASEVYKLEAQLKKKLSAVRTDPKEKSALRKESRFLLGEAKKIWPQGLSAQRGQWLMATRRALLDGARDWARTQLETSGKKWLGAPVMQGLMAQTHKAPARAWAAALTALKSSERLATIDLKTLLGLAPKELSRADRIELEMIAQKTQNALLKSLIGARLNAKDDHHEAHP